MLLLRTVLVALPNESTVTMEEVMSQWKERGRGGSLNLDGTVATAAAEGDVSLPLGPGEWEEPLGLPLCVVCQNVSPIVRSNRCPCTNLCEGREHGGPGKDPKLEGGGIRRCLAIYADNSIKT